MSELRAFLDGWQYYAEPGRVPPGFELQSRIRTQGAAGPAAWPFRFQHADRALGIYLPTAASDYKLEPLMIAAWTRQPAASGAETLPGGASVPLMWVSEGVTRRFPAQPVGARLPPLYLTMGTSWSQTEGDLNDGPYPARCQHQ